MRIAFILGAYSIGTRPLDFTNLMSNARGLTGTEMCFVRTAEELKKLGHELHLFTVRSDKSPSFAGCHIHPCEDRFTLVDDSFDAIISMNEPSVFAGMAKKPKRIVWQMLNDFTFTKEAFDHDVDQYLGVCQQHTDYLKVQTPKPEKWDTLSLGCDPDRYEDKRIPGRVIWCSSADRGLHWLLSQWSLIKEAVPYASLRIFYHFNYGEIEYYEPFNTSPDMPSNIMEMGQRVRYIKRAIQELKHLGVEHVGSISREQMVTEFNEASVFGFSADTVAFSEGFSVSTLEAHASYTLPVMTDCDCLGSIYKDSGADIIKMPLRDNLPAYTKAVIEGLTHENQEKIAQCRKFAQEHTWEGSAKKLAEIIQSLETSQR